ncbi:16002_t:CDS:1, partial [Gigaspora margarita]
AILANSEQKLQTNEFIAKFIKVNIEKSFSKKLAFAILKTSCLDYDI